MRITVNTKNKQEPLGDLYGIFFEDLNHAADSGLYGELVQNRSFEFDPVDNKAYHGLTAWELIAADGKVSARVLTGGAVSEKNPHYLTMDIQEEGNNVGIQNTGFNTGIPLKAGETYFFACYGKREQDTDRAVKVSLRSADGRVYTEQKLYFGLKWEKHELTFQAPETDFCGRLAVTVEGRGKVYLDFVSLFPADTYKGRKGGLRRDLAESHAPLDRLQPFIDDVLDLIEFANGEINTPWGGKRAQLGHPEPFGLKYVGIGNEEVGEAFFERSDIIQAAVRKKYPEIKLVNTAGPFAAGGEFERGWENARFFRNRESGKYCRRNPSDRLRVRHFIF